MRKVFCPQSVFSWKDDSSPVYHEFIGGAWRSFSWQFLVEEVTSLAQGILQMKLPTQSRVCLVGSGAQWMTAYLAVQMASCVPVGIYATSPVDDVRFIVQDCQARLLFASSSSQVAQNNVDVGVPVIVMQEDGPRHATWRDLMKPPHVEQLQQMWTKFDETAEATLIYTSGTTGVSKGVILNYRNVISFTESRANSIHGRHTRALSFLPLSHLAGQGWTIWILVAFGGQVWFSRGVPFLQSDLNESKPTTLFAPPRVYEGWFRGKFFFFFLLCVCMLVFFSPLSFRICFLYNHRLQDAFRSRELCRSNLCRCSCGQDHFTLVPK